MNENVRKLLSKQAWYVATGTDEPNVIPVTFTHVSDDGKLEIADVFMETTLKNIQENSKIAVAVCDSATLEGYQIKGTAAYMADGPVTEFLKKAVSEKTKGALAARGVLVITPLKTIVTTPGPDNKREI
jgi:predicted pyridoxine 5'-phosphate oxidase superfamily flavin-nucleotide-binding protein